TINGLVGSPAFVAPERARGGECGPEGDLWGLGAALYAAVEGAGPFDRDGDAMASLAAVGADEPVPSFRAGPALWPVISGLLRKDPRARLDADAAEQLLRRVVAPPAARPAPARTRGTGPVGERRNLGTPRGRLPSPWRDN